MSIKEKAVRYEIDCTATEAQVEQFLVLLNSTVKTFISAPNVRSLSDDSPNIRIITFSVPPPGVPGEVITAHLRAQLVADIKLEITFPL